MKSYIFPNLDLGRQTNQMLFRSVGIWSGWSSEIGVHPGLSSLTLEIDSKTDDDGGGGGGGDVRCLLWEIWHWFRHFFFCNKPHQARETKASLGGHPVETEWRVHVELLQRRRWGSRCFFCFFFVVIEAGPAVLRQAVCKLAGSCRNDEDGRQNRWVSWSGWPPCVDLGMPSRENGMVRALLPITKFCSPFAKTGFKILKRVLWRPL